MNLTACDLLKTGQSMSNDELSIRVDLWAKAKAWNGDDITWLLLGYDPLLARRKPPVLSEKELAVSRDVLDVLQLQFDGTSASRRLAPVYAIEVFREASMTFPAPLEAAVKRYQLMSVPNRENGPSGSIPEGKVVTALRRRLATAQKIILGMAIVGYSYDPQRRSREKIREIETDVRFIGLSVSEQVIAETIRDAHEEHLKGE